MSRIVFALVVPMVAAVMAAIVGANWTAVAFGGEGCRSHDGVTLRWGAAGEVMLAQLIFGIGFALAVAVLSAVMRRRFAETRLDHTGWFEWAAAVGFLLLSVTAVLDLLACRMQPYAGLGRAAGAAAMIAFAAALAILIVNYVRGLAARSE